MKDETANPCDFEDALLAAETTSSLQQATARVAAARQQDSGSLRNGGTCLPCPAGSYNQLIGQPRIAGGSVSCSAG